MCQWKKDKYQSDFHLDCANGVGSLAMEYLLAADLDEYLHITMINNETENPAENLNKGCGTEHVYVNQVMPKRLNANIH